MTHKPNRLARFARPGVAALLMLLAMLGMVIGAGPAQAASAASVAPVADTVKTKTITAPLNLQGKGGVTTNATVTGTCGSIFLNVRLASANETKFTYGYKSTQGPVSSHNLFGVWVNPPTFASDTFGDVGSPNVAEFETTDKAITGIPSLPAAFVTVSVLTPNGPCFGVVAEALLF